MLERALAVTVVVLALVLAHASAAAQTQQIGVAATGVNAGGGSVAIDGRLRWSGGVALGLGIQGGGRDALFLGGYPEHGGVHLDGWALLLAPLVRAGELELNLRVTSGVGYERAIGSIRGPYRDAWLSETEVAMLAHVRLERRWLLRAGAILGLALEVTPTVQVADQTQLLTAGLGWSPGRAWMLYATVDAGGSYGFDGDNGKVIVRGTVGLRFDLGNGDALSAY